MPLYTIFAKDGSISDKTKAKIAEEITRIHAEVMKRSWLYGFPIKTTGLFLGPAPSIGRSLDVRFLASPCDSLRSWRCRAVAITCSFRPMESLRSSELQSGEKGAFLLCGPKGTEEGAVERCSICGREHASFEFPGTTEKFCSRCSADCATIVLLTAEIDSATLDGGCVDELRSELSAISRQILERSQSSELSNG
jgi:hypothetical protein